MPPIIKEHAELSLTSKTLSQPTTKLSSPQQWNLPAVVANAIEIKMRRMKFFFFRSLKSRRLNEFRRPFNRRLFEER